MAGARGLPFAANYHVSPATVLDAVEGYRAAFRPSGVLDRPWVMVSADVVVGRDDVHARELAAGYAPWVHSIRTGAGAIPFPDAAGAGSYEWDAEVVGDRLETQLVGDAATVVERLAALRDLTGADELLVTTITHDHADRVESYRLVADGWTAQAAAAWAAVSP